VEEVSRISQAKYIFFQKEEVDLRDLNLCEVVL